jgi:hypothetical protein
VRTHYTLNGMTPCEQIRKAITQAPDRAAVRQILTGLTVAQLAEVADELRRPGGLIPPFNSGPPPCKRTKAGLTGFVVELAGRDLDGRAIEHAVRG